MNDQWYKWREFKMKNRKLICVCAKIKLKKLIVLDLIHSKKYLFEMWRTLIKTRKVLSRYYSLLSYYLRCSLIKVYLYFGRSRIYKFRSSFSKIVRIFVGVLDFPRCLLFGMFCSFDQLFTIWYLLEYLLIWIP